MKQKFNKTVQKIALILVCILSFNFIAPTYVSNAASIGGVLFKPIKSFLVALVDITMDFLDLGVTGTWKNVIKSDVLNGDYSSDDIWDDNGDDELDLPVFRMSPDAIFSNKVELLNIDFINPINENDYDVRNDATTDGLKDLRKLIASWYVAIRNLALVAMLSVLVYVGIKIIISSAASDKAKYKQMLVDWLVGMCLLSMLHYIMAFTIFFTEKITDLIGDSSSSLVEFDNPEGSDGKKGPITFNKKYTYNGKEYSEGDELEGLQNLTAYARFYVQLKDVKKSFAYLIIYAVLAVYTIIFTVVYLKRVVTIAFLTMIAPLVAMTYPIDKMNDGKAQAFNFWFKEYLTNALIQPFHLILYTVLIGSSVKLASSNLLYAIVAMGFLFPAEKLLKKMFGLDRASTPPGLGGALAAGAGSEITKRLLNKGGNKSSSSNNTANSTNGNSDGAIRSSAKYDFGDINTDKSENNESGSNGKNAENNELDGQGQAMLDYATDPNNMMETSAPKSSGNGQEKFENKENEALPKNTDDNKNKNEKPKGTARKMAKLAGKKALRSAGRTIRNPKTWKNLGRKALRTAGTIGGAYVGLHAAALTGALTGDASKAIAAFGTSTTIGNRLGDKTANMAGGAFDMAKSASGGLKDLRAEADGGWEAVQAARKERKINQQMKEFKNDSSNQKYFEEKTGQYGSELKETMEQAAYYDQFKGFEDNDSKMKAIELENYYKDQGMNQEDARTMVRASNSMANEYKRNDLNKKETYVNEINNNGGQNAGKAEKDNMVRQLSAGSKYMKGMANKPGRGA